MKRVIHFFYIAVVLLLLPSCGYNLRDVVALQDMKSHPVVFPTSLRMTIGGEYCDFCKIPEGIKLVVYVDSSVCNACVVSKLEKYHELEHIGNNKLHVAIIMNPKGGEEEIVLQELSHYEHFFPVFIDTSSDFLLNNPHIPRDNRFHIFLVDSSSVPVFVGNPSANLKMLKRFDFVFREISQK